MVYRRGLQLVLGLALVVGLLAGCQTAQGPSDEEVIRGLIGQFVKAGNEGEVGAAMALFADDFDMDGLDKEGIQFMLEDGVAAGVEFDDSEAEVKVAPDGKTATVSGVMVDYTPYTTKLEKRGGKWLVVGAEEEY